MCWGACSSPTHQQGISYSIKTQSNLCKWTIWTSLVIKLYTSPEKSTFHSFRNNFLGPLPHTFFYGVLVRLDTRLLIPFIKLLASYEILLYISFMRREIKRSMPPTIFWKFFLPLSLRLKNSKHP